MTTGDWMRDRELSAELRSEERRNRLSLLLSSLRARPDKAYDFLRLAFADGWRASWAVRDADEATTVPPKGEDG